MLRLFVRPVACCCVLLGVVAQSLKPVKLLDTSKRTQQLPTMLRPFARDFYDFAGDIEIWGFLQNEPATKMF